MQNSLMNHEWCDVVVLHVRNRGIVATKQTKMGKRVSSVLL